MCHPDAPSATSGPEIVGEETTIPGDGESMPAYLARGEGTADRGSVVVVGDIYGARTPFYEHLARLLAEQGFDAIVPEYFFRVGPLTERTQEAALAPKARLDERRALLDLDAAISWARARTDHAADRIGTLGFSLGGTFVLDLAAMRDDVATVCCYEFPAGAPGPPGDPARTAPKPLDEVERMQGPLLGFWGGRDERVGIANVHELARALEQQRISFGHTIYPGLDHGFLQSGFDPEAPGHEHAAASWQRTLAFFDEHLRTRVEKRS
jgi:carboxymethylenebutenolidase